MKTFKEFMQSSIKEDFSSKTREELEDLLKHHKEDLAKVEDGDDCKDNLIKEIEQIKALLAKMS